MKLIGFFSLLLAPMIICGKINSNLEFESNFTVIMMSGPYKDTSTVVQLSADLNKLLTEAASRREFNFEVQFPIKNQAAFRSSSKTTC
ncbi:hypothetical protein, partial [Aeromonas taiwanensis]